MRLSLCAKSQPTIYAKLPFSIVVICKTVYLRLLRRQSFLEELLNLTEQKNLTRLHALNVLFRFFIQTAPEYFATPLKSNGQRLEHSIYTLFTY